MSRSQVDEVGDDSDFRGDRGMFSAVAEDRDLELERRESEPIPTRGIIRQTKVWEVQRETR